MKNISICVALVFVGCATKVEYRTIYKPIRCSVEMPQKPKRMEDKIEMLRQILIYSHLLESRLKLCIGEKDGRQDNARE